MHRKYGLDGERGRKSPLLLPKSMINERKIRRLLEAKLSGTDLFTTGVVMKPGNVIRIFLDSEKEVTIKDCVAISRFVESNIDKEAEDFDLQVSSAGADQPLSDIRQYRKNTGRGIKVTLHDDSVIEGRLSDVSKEGITVVPFAPKKGKSKKKERTEMTGESKMINYDSIKEAKVIISFK